MTQNEIPGNMSELSSFLKTNLGIKERDRFYIVNFYLDLMNRKGYHNIKHVFNMLKILKEGPTDIIGNVKYLTFAIMFHDIVYSPGSTTNEKDSVGLFKDKFCCAFPKDKQEEIYEYVSRLILESVKPEITHPKDGIEKDIVLLHDLDYSILGSDWSTYLEYVMGIWFEHSEKYTIVDYIKGRLDFLSNLLSSQKPLFCIFEFNRKYHYKAFENLEREAIILEGSFDQ